MQWRHRLFACETDYLHFVTCAKCVDTWCVYFSFPVLQSVIYAKLVKQHFGKLYFYGCNSWKKDKKTKFTLSRIKKFTLLLRKLFCIEWQNRSDEECVDLVIYGAVFVTSRRVWWNKMSGGKQTPLTKKHKKDEGNLQQHDVKKFSFNSI